MATGKATVSRNVDSIETSAQYGEYTGVRILAGEDDDGKQLEYLVGDETGRVLEVSNPFVNATTAKTIGNNILSSIKGYKYQPISVSGAVLNPAAEIGDGINANGIYSGIFKRYTTFGKLMKSDVEAPSEEEIDHEYAYETKENREYSRFVSNTKSTLKLQAGEIAARVTREGGNSKSFGWTLTEDGFVLSSGSKEVFKADESGITVTGEIKATSGYIGSESSGFKITGSAIYKNMTSLSSTTTPGIYIGTDGISLGGGKFKVTSSGALYATTGTFTGSVYANQIQVGGSAGYISGSQIGSGTVGYGNVGFTGTLDQVGYNRTNIGTNATNISTNAWNISQNAANIATLKSYFTNVITAQEIRTSTLVYGSYTVVWKHKSDIGWYLSM